MYCLVKYSKIDNKVRYKVVICEKDYSMLMKSLNHLHSLKRNNEFFIQSIPNHLKKDIIKKIVVEKNNTLYTIEELKVIIK